jgi:hypothetical protein
MKMRPSAFQQMLNITHLLLAIQVAPQDYLLKKLMKATQR